MTPTDDEVMTEEDKVALAAAREIGASDSRWNNAPGDIVITKRGGKDVNIPS